ncbi:MAG TPA: M48 family metalloprotease [Methylibium sp.]|uniref:M48 family metalloprotease n=1 Tax=Methylibium sp. TaxID=2067992 RepID=UPI002DBE25E6|nr:M48 family metalloprotease [Methylibium sp.]HEU4458601.1 M48 family metalloprotease [Methylibium sp.]
MLLLLAATLALGLQAPPARAEGILQVLERSQQIQLDALRRMKLDDADARSQRIHATFDAVLAHLNVDPNVPLIVVRAPILAVCLMGKVVVVNEALADLTESERAFILAHELGHIAHNHWAQLGELYLQHIPGEVVQQHTDGVAGRLGREASALTHQQEYEADGFALRLLRRMGAPDDTPIVLFQQHLPPVKTTATHPGTAQRVAHLRELQ